MLFSSAFAAMFGTFIKYKFQRTYDAILAAPVDTEELVTAEALWIAARAGVYGCVPMLVAIVFGLDPALGDAARAVLRRRSPASAGRASGSSRRAMATSIENFNYIISAGLTPLFLVAGTFFPLDAAAGVGADARAAQPALPPASQLVRHAAFGFDGWSDVGPRRGAGRASALLMWRLAIWRLEKRLID